MPVALVNGRILRDGGLVEGQCVLLEQGRILDVVEESDPRCQEAERRDLGGHLLLPGFIDSQVNGGGGVLFNDAPSVEAIHEIGRAHRKFGTTGFLPTLISADLDVVARAIAAVQGAIKAGVPGVLGIHIEGPFLNVARKGVHDPAKLRELDTSAVGLLTSLRGGKTLVTLAPEMTTPEIIQNHVRRHVHGIAPRTQRLHPSLQRHVTTHGPRAGRGRRGAR
jgi:N-acetylglucosamine-6-phosphate deacetylase